MEPEIPLYFSEDCFGTCDSIGTRNGILRIHDLKTGITPASMKQLLIYAAIFFFEYCDLFKPHDMRTILRIYQNDAIVEHEPDLPELLMIMDRIKTQATLISYLREED
jgi:hypothetical protein